MKHRLDMHIHPARTVLLPKIVLAFAFLTPPIMAFDWNTSGGDSARSGLSTEVGPTTSNVLWANTSLASLGVPVFVERNRAFFVTRLQSTTAPSLVKAFDLDSGVELWSTAIPNAVNPAGGSCMGVDRGLVFVTQGHKIEAIATDTGAFVWESAETFVDVMYIGSHLGAGDLAFAPNGDLLVDAIEAVYRVSALDGSTVWVAPRPGGGEGGRGVAVRNGRVYADQNTANGAQVLVLDLASGMQLYASVPIAGYSAINYPFAGPDGVIHVELLSFPIQLPPPAQPPPQTEQLLALDDTGSALVPRWNAVTPPLTEVFQHGTAPDGSVLRLVRDHNLDFIVERLDRDTGGVIAMSAPIANGQGFFTTAPLAVDALGRVYVAVYGFGSVGGIIALESDLSPLWQVGSNLFAAGTCALGRDGTLVVTTLGGIEAFRTPRTPAIPFCAGDGSATACPCAAGAAGSGCPNSAFATGARLSSDGIASVAADTLVLRGLSMPNSSCLFLQGTTQTAGGAGAVFGDGLRCIGGNVMRLGTRAVNGGQVALPSAPGGTALSSLGQVMAGDVRDYQIWYRNAAQYCTPAAFNLSNGLQVTWAP